MTIKETLKDIKHHVYVSRSTHDRVWWARIDSISNTALGATRFPLQYEESGDTRGEAIKNLHQSLRGQGGLLRSES